MQLSIWGSALFAAMTLTALSSCVSPASTSLTLAEKSLLGKRPISLQWISWDDLGEARVQRQGNQLTISGEQNGADGDFLKIEGNISDVTARRFTFHGTIITQVSHIFNGQPYRRQGKFTFGLYQGGRFWRMIEMDHPDGVVDYVDIYTGRR